jgi:mRNA-degrading endonuclease RelE of RelBE toxin-antitoxin system
MSYTITTIPPFERQLKRLLKKYPSLLKDLTTLSEELKDNPTMGVLLGNDCYKIRMAISSKGRGKSGGARVITYCYIEQTSVVLLSIYDKSEQSNISDNEILELLNLIDNL